MTGSGEGAVSSGEVFTVFCVFSTLTRGRKWGARETEHEDLEDVKARALKIRRMLFFFLAIWLCHGGTERKRKAKNERVFFGLFFFLVGWCFRMRVNGFLFR